MRRHHDHGARAEVHRLTVAQVEAARAAARVVDRRPVRLPAIDAAVVPDRVHRQGFDRDVKAVQKLLEGDDG